VRLSEDLGRVAAIAAESSASDEVLAGIVPTEPGAGVRVYLCAYRGEGGRMSWLAFDDELRPVESRSLVHDVVSIAAMCELAEEVAGGGDLDELRSRLVALRLTENPAGVDEAEDATVALQTTLGAPPRVATPAHLDAVGSATRRLEQALGEGPGSPFAEAMKQGIAVVDELAKDVERNYKAPLK
jgi:hypothetical protein